MKSILFISQINSIDSEKDRRRVKKGSTGKKEKLGEHLATLPMKYNEGVPNLLRHTLVN